MKSRQIDFDKTYLSDNYGEFKILKEIPHGKHQKRRVLIKFIQTGNTSEVSHSEALKGCVKDTMLPSIFGVGYLGNAHKKGNEKAYNIWISMLSRCYNPNEKAYKYYGSKGCYVDSRWHCFENFLEDIKKLPGYELLEAGKQVELDKDILQPDTTKKFYSKENCMWVTKDKNNRAQLLSSNQKKEYSSKYIGVCYDRRWNVFQAQINIDGKQVYIGKFTNEIAAANAYNYYADMQGIEITKNDCPFMNKSEWEKFKKKRGRKNERF